ncbi:MAG: DUF4197 domain-containing protein [Paludibacter sp.]|nr:DUF4197 domain-containing protein [Paludibacter sp.]
MRKILILAFISINLLAVGQSTQSKIQSLLNKVTSSPVSNNQNVEGLKNSLNVGIEKAVGKLGIENGFYNDPVLKLQLPPEAKSITNNIRLVPGGKELVNKTILSMNRTAEDAVKEATPIFKNAILKMSITDAVGILFGKEDAATQYLRQNTYAELKAAFAPKVKVSLGKPLVANISTTQTWNLLSSSYNGVANSMVGKFSRMKPINVNMEDYVTEKALDALFVKIAEEEKAIRTNPAARVNDLLKNVFGQLDKK